MARVSPHVISARLTPAQRGKITRAANALQMTIAEFTRGAALARSRGDTQGAVALDMDRVRLNGTPARHAIIALTALGSSKDPTAVLGNLLAALDLPSDSTAEQIQTAIDILLAALAPATGDPLAGDAEPPPTAPTGGRTVKTAHGEVTLSASEIKTCEETGAKPEAYAETRARAPRPQPRTVAAKFEIGPDGNVRLARR
jgi:uncharacterized protein (DUF1778 family)